VQRLSQNATEPGFHFHRTRNFWLLNVFVKKFENRAALLWFEAQDPSCEAEIDKESRLAGLGMRANDRVHNRRILDPR
jgi:hypothetical protein